MCLQTGPCGKKTPAAALGSVGGSSQDGAVNAELGAAGEGEGEWGEGEWGRGRGGEEGEGWGRSGRREGEGRGGGNSLAEAQRAGMGSEVGLGNCPQHPTPASVVLEGMSDTSGLGLTSDTWGTNKLNA